MPLKIYLRGDVWHYRGTVAGRRLRGSTGVSKASKQIAQQLVSQIEERQWRGRLDGPGSVLTFAQAALLYRAAGKPTRFLERVEDHWRDTPVKDITGGRIRAACRELYPTGKPATWNRCVIVPTQAIINFAATEHELCPKVFVKRWPVEKKEVKSAPWSWVAEFASSTTPRLGGLCIFMFLTGARISEACSLRWRDVDLSRQRALIRQTKVGSERWAHLPSEMVVSIANLPGERSPDSRVFGYGDRHLAWRAWEKAIERAGIEYLHPHCCRHGFATSLLRAGVDVVTVAKLGGWKSPAQVLATYGHASEDRTLTDVLTRQEHTPNPVSTNALIKKRISG